MRDILPVVVDGLWRQGAKNLAVRLVSADGQPLPAWAPGAHIDLHLPCGLIRQYSLTGSPAGRDHYLLCVGEFLAEPLADKSLHEVWDFVLRVNQLGQEYFLPNIAISLTQRTLYGVLHQLLAHVHHQSRKHPEQQALQQWRKPHHKHLHGALPD